MLSMNSLGNNGRLGNQMFQYASLAGIATRKGYDFVIPPSFFVDESHTNRLHDVFNINCKVGYTEFISLQERTFYFDLEIFENCPNNVDLFGYFQSEKYFKHIEDFIRNQFVFKKKYEVPFEDFVTIHVRRGDYVHQPQNHPVCSHDYYFRSKKYFPEGIKFLVISDDLDWCKNQTVFSDCEFFNGEDDIHDLYCMSKANGNIIANSSFSWWGAWLNNNPIKTVTVPLQWFGPNIDYHLFDLIPSKWIIL